MQRPTVATPKSEHASASESPRPVRISLRPFVRVAVAYGRVVAYICFCFWPSAPVVMAVCVQTCVMLELWTPRPDGNGRCARLLSNSTTHQIHHNAECKITTAPSRDAECRLLLLPAYATLFTSHSLTAHNLGAAQSPFEGTTSSSHLIRPHHASKSTTRLSRLITPHHAASRLITPVRECL